MRQVRTDRVTATITTDLYHEKLIQRLMSVAAEERRSINFLVLEAIREFLDRKEGGRNG